MAKHECPDCGASHEMSAEGRIAKLEERVRELEADRHVCPHPHWYYQPTYYPWIVNTNAGTWRPSDNTVITYDSTTAPQFTLT